MPTQNEFIAWASSPERTLEEAYCAERLVEEGYTQWCRGHRPPRSLSRPGSGVTGTRLARQRRLNPAHRAKLDKPMVARAAEALTAMTFLSLDAHGDRPLRDISGLRFLPQLRILSLHGHEFSDLSVLRAMPALESLSISSDELEDFTPLAAVTKLKSLQIHLRQPWPCLRGLEALGELESLHWTGNLLPLEDIPRFGKVRIARFNPGVANCLPLRDATRLPEMPWLELLDLDGLHRLDGITRWPRLRNLSVGGLFKDLHPLTGLRGLTHLTLKGELTRDLSPLAQLPELQRLHINSHRPQDYSVLAETPRLHEVFAEGCQINAMELATLHAVLSPWEDEFAAHRPRPALPCRFVICKHPALPASPRAGLAPAARWHDDTQMAASESRWFVTRLLAALNRLLGPKPWGRAWAVSNGIGRIRLGTVEAVEQLAAIVDTTRQFLFSTAHPWHVWVAVDLRDPDGDGPVAGGKAQEIEEQAIQREIEEIRDRRKRRKEEEAYLEREHRLRLLAQAGKTVNPEEFAASDDASLMDSARGDAVEERESAGDSPAAAGELCLRGVITEEGLFVDVEGRAAAEHLMDRKAEDAAA